MEEDKRIYLLNNEITQEKNCWLNNNINGFIPKKLIKINSKYFKGLGTINKITTHWEGCCACGCNEKLIRTNIQLRRGKLKESYLTEWLGCENELIKGGLDKRANKNKYDLDNEEYGIGYDIKGQEFYFDKEYYNKIKNYYWFINSHGYITTIVKNHKIFLHHLVMDNYEKYGYINNKINFILIDHINRKPNDNRKQNLRISNSFLNKQNISTYKNNSSGIIGVSWSNKKELWRVDITVNRKRKYLGMYENKEEAIRVRLLGEMIWFEDGYEPQRDLFNKYKIYRLMKINGIEVDLKEWGRIKNNDRKIFQIGRYWMNTERKEKISKKEQRINTKLGNNNLSGRTKRCKV